MPCAGILCVELLRASSLVPPAQQSELSSTAAARNRVKFSRSEVVQNLVMFRALLDWIRPTDNNAQLSKKFKTVLQRIIDAVFDSLGSSYGIQAQMPSEKQPQGHCGPQDQPSPGQDISTATGREHDIDSDMNTFNDMDWLNTVDWTQGGWLEQINPPFPS